MSYGQMNDPSQIEAAVNCPNGWSLNGECHYQRPDMSYRWSYQRNHHSYPLGFPKFTPPVYPQERYRTYSYRDVPYWGTILPADIWN